MNVLFNSNRLSELLNNLQLLTGIWVNIFDADGKDIRLFGNAAAFCQHIQAETEGRRRCEDCDARAVEKCAALGRAYQYRCHAGLKEIVVPIYDQGVPISSVAERVGFSDYNYFTKIFKAIEGVTPSAYRKHNGQH